MAGFAPSSAAPKECKNVTVGAFEELLDELLVRLDELLDDTLEDDVLDDEALADELFATLEEEELVELTDDEALELIELFETLDEVGMVEILPVFDEPPQAVIKEAATNIDTHRAA